MGDPTALQTAVAAMHAVAQIGMPEARIILAQAVVHNAMAPKSNAAYLGINEAIADVRAGRGGAGAAHLRGSGYAGAERLGHGEGYVYAHDEPDGVAAQQYLPDDLARRRQLLPADRPRVRGAPASALGVALGTAGTHARALTGAPAAASTGTGLRGAFVAGLSGIGRTLCGVATRAR